MRIILFVVVRVTCRDGDSNNENKGPIVQSPIKLILGECEL